MLTFDFFRLRTVLMLLVASLVVYCIVYYHDIGLTCRQSLTERSVQHINGAQSPCSIQYSTGALSQRPVEYTTSVQPSPQPSPLAILFTTVSNRTDKLLVHINTIRNWATFFPDVQPVVFTMFTSGPIIDVALANGWIILPVPRTNKYNAPFLKSMFASVIGKWNATFYGYVNGDILFDRGLLTTLQVINGHLSKLKQAFLFGRRSNFNMTAASDEVLASLWQQEPVEKLVKSNKTQLFRSDAFDYFILTPNYPFDKLLDLVVGRTGFDTYFSARSNQLGVPTIDGTGAISALHQTTIGGNFESNRFENKDNNKFNRQRIGVFKYSDGLAKQATYSAKLIKAGVVKLECRKCNSSILT